MEETIEYLGNQITIRTRKVGRGWKASYQIGNEDEVEMGDRALEQEEIVAGEAKITAKSVIDGRH